jgi:hypothetical protein
MWGALGAIIFAGLAWKLYRDYEQASARKALVMDLLFAKAFNVVEGAAYNEEESQGFPRLVGHYKGFPVQVRPIIDTLPTRRLPALWLLVTIQSSLPLKARFDMMMRPSGPTTFSNFDHLPQTLHHPSGFPEQAVIRTDDADEVVPADVIRPYISAFFGPRAKELLVTQNGLRMVWLLAEADRTRYGIFRQAEFGDVQINAKDLQGILDTLLDIRLAVMEWTETQT